MPLFIVNTTERVEGTYAVQAASEDEARGKFDGKSLINWDGVTQIEYMAWDVDVYAVVEVP